MNINLEIDKLISYGISKGLMNDYDKPYALNKILNILNLDAFEETSNKSNETLDHLEILNNLVMYAYDNKLIESANPPYSDLLDTAIMDCLMPRPSEVIHKFESKYKASPEEATDYFYKLSKDSHYIRTDRIKKNMIWQVGSEFGEFDITVNLSKPEKDPKAIEMALKQKETNYPKCLLCLENVGYRGTVTHPARQSHRVIPMVLNGEDWFLQYSPYSYFNEHSIVFKKEHEPMVIGENTFKRLLDFVDVFPHYFIGSNADLPLVGGSMLSHDHYQCGRNVFPMEKTNILKTYKVAGFDDVELKHLNWPLSVMRLESKNKINILKLSVLVHEKWKNHSDEKLDLISKTDEIRHNTVTPIVRKHGDVYQVDIVLRNNRRSDKYPTGIFHPHLDVHSVKKENIGLIEVMGLAVLPSRLKGEMSEITNVILNEVDIKNTEIEKFDLVINRVKDRVVENSSSDDIYKIVKEEVGNTFVKGLVDAGVYKLDEEGIQGLERFIESLMKQ